MDRLYENFNKLLKATSTDFIRYKYTENLWKRRIKRDKCLRNACQ